MSLIDGLRYSERRAVMITGAAGAMGHVLARGFSRMGADVGLVDRDADGLRAIASELESGGKVLTIAADLAEVREAVRAVEATRERFGRLDAVVNNAGLLIREAIADVSEASFETQLAVNLRAPFFIAQAAVSEMRASGWGRIVNIASIGARTGGITDATVYSAAKAGVVAMTKAFARSYAGDGILVNAVAPGAMDTPMMALPDGQREQFMKGIPLGRFSQPEEVAEIVFWLASEANTYATGGTFDVNGGQLMW